MGVTCSLWAPNAPNRLCQSLDITSRYDAWVCVSCSASLGAGFRLGFLGLLHMDVFQQRLEQEYNASVITTSPNVPYGGNYGA